MATATAIPEEAQMPVRYEGKVERWGHKGYGFIASDHGTFFFHVGCFDFPEELLSQDLEVTFEAVFDVPKPLAVDIEIKY